MKKPQAYQENGAKDDFENNTNALTLEYKFSSFRILLDHFSDTVFEEDISTIDYKFKATTLSVEYFVTGNVYFAIGGFLENSSITYEFTSGRVVPKFSSV